MSQSPKVTFLLLCSILISFLYLVDRLNWRWDLSEENIYTISPATKSLVDQLDDRLQIKLYFNEDISGAEHLLPSRKIVSDLLEEISVYSRGKVVVETVDPTVDMVASRDAEHVGIEPITITDKEIGGISVDSLYQGLEMRYQNQSAVIPFVIPVEFEFSFSSRLSQLIRGDRQIVGFFSREPALPPPLPGISQQAPSGRVYERLREILGDRYAVRDYRKILPNEAFGADLAALIVASPESVTDFEHDALRDYLESGGHVLVLVDNEEVDVGQGFSVISRETNLNRWLEEYGLFVHPHFVYDLRSQVVPVGEELVTLPDGRKARNLVTMPYGLFPVVESDGLSSGHVVTAGLDSISMMWAHPISYKQKNLNLSAENLLRTSEQSWVLPSDTSLGMSLGNLELLKAIISSKGKPSRYALATSLTGSFREDAPQGVLVVIGDADLFHNRSLPSGSENVLFANNLIDWLAQDSQLISLRSRGKKSRPLNDYYREMMVALGGPAGTDVENRELDRLARNHRLSEQRKISWGNVLLPPLLMLFAALGHFSYRRQRAKLPYYSQGGNDAS